MLKRKVAGPLGFEPRISGLEGRRAFWIFAMSKLRHGPSLGFHSKTVEYSFIFINALQNARKNGV